MIFIHFRLFFYWKKKISKVLEGAPVTSRPPKYRILTFGIYYFLGTKYGTILGQLLAFQRVWRLFFSLPLVGSVRECTDPITNYRGLGRLWDRSQLLNLFLPCMVSVRDRQ